MIGSGKVLYHMTYIDDLVRGLLLCGRKPEALGEVFTIAGEEYTTIRELVNLIACVLGKPNPKFRIPFYPVFLAAIICDSFCRPFGLTPPFTLGEWSFFTKTVLFPLKRRRGFWAISLK
jgi:dihydroflavonol-4-reductase